MIKVGIVGAGKMGQLHAKSAMGNADIKIEAVCDVYLEAAGKLALECNAKAYQDIDTMLNDIMLDAIIVSTPDNLHAESVIKSANAGKAIMLEKPFATNREDANRMLDAIEKNGVKVQMAHLFRFLPIYMNIKNAAEAGELGDILSTNVTMLNNIYVPTQMLKWAASSSPAWFLLSHSIDTIMWINNCKFKSIRAYGVKKKLVSLEIDTYDLIKVVGELENGAISSFEANWVMPKSFPTTAAVKMMVSGTEGSMTIDTGDQFTTKSTNSEYNLPGFFEYDLYGYYSGLRRNMLEGFVRSIKNDNIPPTVAIDGYNTFCVLEAIDESISSGKEVIVRYR